MKSPICSSAVTPLTVIGFLLAAAFAATDASPDWSNLGGGPGRNGLVSAQGPTALSQWGSGAPTSLISWTPIVEGDRLFTVRQLQA